MEVYLLKSHREQFQEFYVIADELDELTAEGYFGEDIKSLVEKRDSMSTPQYLYEIIKDWSLETNQFNKLRVKELILIFLELYKEAFSTDQQKTINIINAAFYGLYDNPELEYMSSYEDFVLSFTETKTINNSSPKITELKRYGDSIAKTYSKGVELVNKTLVTCIVLNKITKKETYDYFKIYNLTLHKKIKEFTKDQNNKYEDLIAIVNRDIRNAEAHLNLRFDPKLAEYTYKKSIGGKVVIERISVETMIKKYLVGVGIYCQAFMYSGVLFTLAIQDMELFKNAYKLIYGE